MRLALLLAVLLLLVLQAQLWFGQGSRSELADLRGQLALLQAEVGRLEAGNSLLARDVAVLQTGPAAVEARARQDLGMVGPGETFFLVVED